MFNEITNELILGTDKPFASCHASHLAVLPSGDILAVWFAGSKEGADDSAIWCSRRTGGSWSQPLQIAAGVEEPCWNPVLMNLPGGELMLFYKIGRWIKEWRTLYKISKDEGRSWSAASELVPGDRGGRGPVRNKVIVLADGTWIAPASAEDGIWTSFADRSQDQGLTWQRSEEIGIAGIQRSDIQAVKSDIPVSEQSFYGRGVIQPSVWESQPGQVHMLMRSSEGFIHRSDSQDGGVHWSAAYPTSVPNNNSGMDVVRMEDGTLVLCCNPVGVNWGPRTPLVLMASTDNGLTWTQEAVLENGEGEFSYPAILAYGDQVYLTYTWNRVNIAFRKFSRRAK
ncbi:sialidase family protein [Paenibacillus humicus]|uniref:sialidase family protein n=1 Tax=Paenibacillus humicus TaxID=412861 RepID=UPI003D2D24A3